MRNIILLLLIATTLFSCKRSKQEMLIGTWQATLLINPQMDTMMMDGQTYIDTLGKSTNAADNLKLYGITNVDSMRHILQQQLDSIKDLQQQAVGNTQFKFRKDGVAVLTFSGNVDSTKWYFDDDGSLMLDEMKEKGAGDKIKMEILDLNDSILKLKFVENGSNSTVIFHSESK